MATDKSFACRVQEIADRLSAEGAVALAELCDVSAFRLVRFAAAMVRHQQDAEDAVQAVLMRLAADSQRLVGIESAWSYLLRMVRNEVLANARRYKRYSTAGTMEDLITCCPVDEAEREESY